MALRSPYRVSLGRDNPLDAEIELQARFASAASGGTRHHRALESLMDSPLLNDPENWWKSFDRVASDYRGLNAALRGDTQSDHPLPWGIVDQGVRQAGALAQTDRHGWLARTAFWGRCYTVMADEVHQRVSFRGVPGVGQTLAIRALTGLNLYHVGGYLAQLDQLKGQDAGQGEAAPKLVEDMINGAQSLHDCFRRAHRGEEKRKYLIRAQRMFESTARKLDREIVP